MNIKSMKYLCQTSKQTLAKHIYTLLKEKYQKVDITDNYIIAEGTLPICVLAHLDTIFQSLPEEIFYDKQQEVLWSPQGAGFDDRAGVYLILQLINADFYPSIIFTDKEEIGGLGAKALIKDYPTCPFEDCRALIQLDRANRLDAVFYDCDNEDFKKYICSFGFEKTQGLFSDISIIAPVWEIAAVNLSVGYKDEHQYRERLYCKWTEETFYKLVQILRKSSNMESYQYIPCQKVRRTATDIFNTPSYEKGKCAICDSYFTEGRRLYDIDPRDPYEVCENCFRSYYAKTDPDTAEIVLYSKNNKNTCPF